MRKLLHGLDLFSGIGGISFALSEWIKPIAYCENDRYAQAVLLSRMGAGDLCRAPIWDDVKTLKGRYLPHVDIIYGGFPCQDLSIAGLGKGLAGERSGLFYEILRLAKEIKPTFIFLENVPGITNRGLRQVAESLSSIGYDLRWDVISAAEIGAEFQGKRWFALAKARSTRLQRIHKESGQIDLQSFARNSRIPNNFREAHPDVLRKGHGVPFALDRIKCLGNSVVPAQVEEAFCRLIGLK